MLQRVKILQFFNVKELRVLRQVSIAALSLNIVQRASVRSAAYLITLADGIAVVGLVHTVKIHYTVDVLIIAPVQREDHEIVIIIQEINIK